MRRQSSNVTLTLVTAETNSSVWTGKQEGERKKEKCQACSSSSFKRLMVGPDGGGGGGEGGRVKEPAEQNKEDC